MPNFCELLGKKTILSTNLSTLKVDKDLQIVKFLIRKCLFSKIDIQNKLIRDIIH